MSESGPSNTGRTDIKALRTSTYHLSVKEMSSLTTGYYLIKSKAAEGNVGIGANGSHDRRLVMLAHPGAHGIKASVSNT